MFVDDDGLKFVIQIYPHYKTKTSELSLLVALIRAFDRKCAHRLMPILMMLDVVNLC